MKLGDWLKWKEMTREAFAELVGVTHASVSGYALGNHIPGREPMRKIIEVTEGAVTPADFYQ